MSTLNNRVKRRGSFAPLSANYYLDDALAQAGEAAELLYVRALAFCAATLSDGYVTRAQLIRGPGVGMRDAEKRAKRLVEVGAWEAIDDGYRIRSWLSWNRSKDEIMALAEGDRKRKVRGHDDDDPTPPGGDTDTGKTDSVQNRNGNHPDSERIPDGIPKDSQRSRAGGRTPARTRTPHTHTDTDKDSSGPVTGPPTSRERPDLRALSGTAHSPTAHRLARTYATTTTRVPSAKLSQLAREIDRLLGDDYTEREISRAIRVWGEKNLAPGALPSIAHELAQQPPQPPTFAELVADPRPVGDIPDAEIDVDHLLGPGQFTPDIHPDDYERMDVEQYRAEVARQHTAWKAQRLAGARRELDRIRQAQRGAG